MNIFTAPAVRPLLRKLGDIRLAIVRLRRASEWAAGYPIQQGVGVWSGFGPFAGGTFKGFSYSYLRKDGSTYVGTTPPPGWKEESEQYKALVRQWWTALEELKKAYAAEYERDIVRSMTERGYPMNPEGIRTEAARVAYDRVIFGPFGRPHQW